MSRILHTCAVLFALSALPACSQGQGERCNPLLFNNECSSGRACVYPTAPSCGVAYCCAVDNAGNVTDTDPNCQPDPTLSCAPDFSMAPIVDMTMAD